MLNELFGSETTVKCLLYLSAMKEGYALEVSQSYGISNTQVSRTLDKLEKADILFGSQMGRSRVYTLNSRWFLYKELKALLDKVVMNMPLEDQERFFMKRKRPRKKNKPI